jgi:hypothetical protein
MRQPAFRLKCRASANIRGARRIQREMDIEQKLPNKPNFLLIVGLFCVTILVIFVLAYFFVDFDGKHLTFHHHRAHPTSELVMPGRSGAEAHVVA